MHLLVSAAVCALVLWIRKKKIRRRYWVHPIYTCRLLKGKFYTLYENYMNIPLNFFHTSIWIYQRLMISSWHTWGVT